MICRKEPLRRPLLELFAPSLRIGESQLIGLLSLVGLGLGLSAAAAQDFSAPLVTMPSGVEPIPGSPGGLGSGFNDALDGFNYGLGGSVFYDSNIFQGDDAALGPIEDDIVYSIRPYLAYRNPGGDLTFGGNLALDYIGYIENADLGGLGYSGGLDVAYRGGKIRATAAFRSSLTYGTNRDFNNAFIRTLNSGFDLGLDYILSPKTSIDSRFGYNWVEPEGSNFAGTNNTIFDVSALWRYSALTRIGPGVAWTQQGGDRQSNRNTIGPILRIDYKLAEKVALDGTFGLDFVDSGPLGGSDTTFTTRLGVNYQASRIWGLNLSVFKGTQANGGLGTSFRDIFSVRTGYSHKIRRARLNLGLAYETSAPDGLGAAFDPDRDFLNFDASVGMPVFYNRASASVFYGWRQETGGRDYTGHRFGFSLSSAF